MTYHCEAVFDCPAGPYLVLLKAGGDTVRIECLPHEFGPFQVGDYYEIKIEKIQRHLDRSVK